MANMDDINERLAEFQKSGLIAEYEVLVADDSVRVRVVAPADQDAAKVKAFIADTFAGILSATQINVEAAPPPAT